MLRIAILDDYQSIALSMTDWSRIGPDAEIVSFNRHLSEAEAARELVDFDVLCIMRERMALPRSLINALPRLKLIAVTGSHTQVIDKQAAEERGIPVTLTSPRASYSAAELTWALVLALARKIPVEDRNIREGRWQTSVGFRLEGRTLGLMGLGTLGARVARYGQAFDMPVIAWSANLDPQRARERLSRAFEPAHSRHILLAGESVGFVVVLPMGDHLLLDHLYIAPQAQGRGIGSWVMAQVLVEADRLPLPVRVTALKLSDANRFYQRHGFVLQLASEWDMHYLRPAKANVDG